MAMSEERAGTGFGFCMAFGYVGARQAKLYQVRVDTKDGLHVFDMWVPGKRPAEKIACWHRRAGYKAFVVREDRVWRYMCTE